MTDGGLPIPVNRFEQSRTASNRCDPGQAVVVLVRCFNLAIDPMPQSDSSYRKARPAQAHCAALEPRLLDAHGFAFFDHDRC